ACPVFGYAQRLAWGGAVALGLGLRCRLFLLLRRHHPSLHARNSLLRADRITSASIARCPFPQTTKPSPDGGGERPQGARPRALRGPATALRPRGCPAQLRTGPALAARDGREGAGV